MSNDLRASRLLESQWPNSTGAPVKGGLSYIKHNGWKRWHKRVDTNLSGLDT